MALIAAGLSQPSKVVVEHSRMADQTHLFRSFAVTGSDHGATPRTDHVVSRFGIFELNVGLMIYVAAHAHRYKQFSFQPTGASRHQ
jgi:hypothetical protein